MSERIYADPRNPKIIFRVRFALGPTFIVGRWDCEREKWAKPAKFAPIGVHTNRDECQRALDAWATMRGIEPIKSA